MFFSGTDWMLSAFSAIDALCYAWRHFTFSQINSLIEALGTSGIDLGCRLRQGVIIVCEPRPPELSVHLQDLPVTGDQPDVGQQVNAAAARAELEPTFGEYLAVIYAFRLEARTIPWYITDEEERSAFVEAEWRRKRPPE